MDYERFLLDHLGTIEQAVRYVARRYRLPPDEVEELSATVRLKLVDRDYEILRNFQGRSTLRTYLVAIALRQFQDERDARWGKWRPSMAAKRLGPVALLLDRLLTREGLSLDEAVEVLRTNHQVMSSREEIEELARRLPSRYGRHFVGEEALENLAAPADAGDSGPGETLSDEADRVEDALLAALETLPGEDVLILKYKFQDNLRIATIARLLGIPEKPLYKRIEKVMHVLQRELEARGVTHEQAKSIVGSAVDLPPLLRLAVARKPPSGPSHT